jgi:dihydroorotase
MLRVEGTIANHNGIFEGAILIDKSTGLIAAVEACKGASDLDTSGCLIFPGFGDLHIHAREDADGSQSYKEDFRTVSAASVQGGVTHVADMPNNPVAPVDDARYVAKERLTAKSAVHVTLYAGIGPETSPLTRHVPYKAFMGPSVGDLFFASQQQLEEVIAKYRGSNVSFHCEDPEILQAHKGAGPHEGRVCAVPDREIRAARKALPLLHGGRAEEDSGGKGARRAGDGGGDAASSVFR